MKKRTCSYLAFPVKQQFLITIFSLFLYIFNVCPMFVYAQTITGFEPAIGISNFQIVNQSSFSDKDTYVSLAVYDKLFHLTERTYQNNIQNVSFSYTKNYGNGYYHMSVQNWQDDIHGSFGISLNNLNFSTSYGNSDGVVKNRQDINGISPNFFHGAVSYSYDYNGATIEHSWSDNLSIHGGAVFIEATGLEDRSVYFGGFSYKKFSTTLSSISRGEESVGYSFIAGWTFDDFEVGYQELDSKYNSNWRELTIANRGNESFGALRLSLGAGSSDLYEDGDETRVTLSYSIPLGGSKQKYSNRARIHSATLNSTVSYSAAMSFQSLSKVGSQAVGSGLTLSSGSPELDRTPRFSDQHRAAYYILSIWNPISVNDNLEYGSAIYQNRDGTYAPSSSVAQGTIDSVSFNPYALVPYGTRATADWHTHGADIPGYLSEEFSSADLAFSDYYRMDGYLGTPKGRMFLYDVDQRSVSQFVSGDDEFILPH